MSSTKKRKKTKKGKGHQGHDMDSSGASKGGKQEWCFCGSTNTDNMIACDNPGCGIEWFHMECVGLEEDNVPDGEWFCQHCTESSESSPRDSPEMVANSSQNSAKPIFICEWCDSQFSSKLVCIEHKKQCSKNSKHSTPPSAARQPPTVDDETMHPIRSRSRSRSPLRSPETESCSSQDEGTLMIQQRPLAQFSDEQILAKLEERGAAFVCVCGIVFQDQTLYFLHRGCHNTSNPKKCSFCHFEADNWYNFAAHFFKHKKTPVK